MKNLMNKLRATYVVDALYQADSGQLKRARHYARDWADALEWAACYPASDAIVIREAFLGAAAVESVATRYSH